MALPGKDATCQVSDDDLSYADLDGIKNFSIEEMTDQHDATDFPSAGAGSGDYDEARKLIGGLVDSRCTLGGDYEDDSSGQLLLRTAVTGGSAIYIQHAYNGVAGDQFTGLVESYDYSAEVGDTSKITYSLVGNGLTAAF